MPTMRGAIDLPGQAHGEIVLWREPDDDIVLLGAMQADAALQVEKLKRLPLASDGYHGDLYVIRGAAERMRRRCDHLIEQAESNLNREREAEKSALKHKREAKR
jgi:hypothetical protein